MHKLSNYCIFLSINNIFFVIILENASRNWVACGLVIKQKTQTILFLKVRQKASKLHKSIVSCNKQRQAIRSKILLHCSAQEKKR